MKCVHWHWFVCVFSYICLGLLQQNKNVSVSRSADWVDNSNIKAGTSAIWKQISLILTMAKSTHSKIEWWKYKNFIALELKFYTFYNSNQVLTSFDIKSNFLKKYWNAIPTYTAGNTLSKFHWNNELFLKCVKQSKALINFFISDNQEMIIEL